MINIFESLKTAKKKYLLTGKIDDNVFEYFEKNDPSKTYKYVEWLVQQFIANKNSDPKNLVALIKQFDVDASKGKIKNVDINSYSLKELINVVGISKKQKTGIEMKKEIKSEGADIVFENDTYLVVVPKTYEASCLYGKGTKWCTTEKRYWDEYKAKKIKLYYIINKKLNKTNPLYKIAVAQYPLIFNKHKKINFKNYKYEVFNATDKSISINKIPFQIPKSIFTNAFVLDNKTKEGIKIICALYEIENYTINEDLSIDVDGNVEFYNEKLTIIPLNFNKIEGSFNCENNQLTSLEGAPKEVEGWFYCNHNQLTSLKGAPREVGDEFNCSNNKLTSLKGSPEKVGEDFDCSYNQLTNLIGAPKEVKNSFYCYENKLTNLLGAPKEIKGDFDCNDNQLINLLGAPEKVGEDFSCNDNQLTSLEGAPNYVKKDFWCEGNPLTEEDIEWLEQNCDIKGKIIS